MRSTLRKRPSYWLLLVLAAAFLLLAFQPAGVFRASRTAAATPAHRRRTPTPATTSNPLHPNHTRTPRPTTLGPSPTPTLPPPEQIGSTNGIVGWGVIMIAVILAVLLWHRPDWVRRRPPPTDRGP